MIQKKLKRMIVTSLIMLLMVTSSTVFAFTDNKQVSDIKSSQNQVISKDGKIGLQFIVL